MLEVRGLDAFYGDAQALWGVDLDVGSGEMVSIVGPNGAGKTTLVNTIAGHPSARGAAPSSSTASTSRRCRRTRVCAHGVATVPEGRRVFAHMTVFDNLLPRRLPQGRPRGLPRRARAEVYALFPRLQRAGRRNWPAGSAAASSRCSPSAGR